MKEENTKSSVKNNLKLSLWSFRFLYKIYPLQTVGYLLTSIIQGLDFIVYSYIFGRTIDIAIQLAEDPSSTLNSLIPLLFIFLIYLGISSISSTLQNFCYSKINYYSGIYIQKETYYKIKSLGLQELEKPGLLDDLAIIQKWAYRVPELYRSFCAIITNIFSLISTGFILYSYVPILIPIILVWEIIQNIPLQKLREKDWKYQLERTEKRRNAYMNSSFLNDKDCLREILITGSSEYLDQKYSNFFFRFMKGLFDIRKKQIFITLLFRSISNFIQVVGYGVILFQTIGNKISIGSTTFAIASIGSFAQSVRRIGSSIQSIDNMTIKLNTVYNFYNLKTSFKDGSIKIPRLSKGPSIKLKNITFRYPQSTKHLFKNLSLKIKHNEKIAIVGENGAGKTSLVKLLIRLYDVQKGEILINDKNIQNYKLDDWYKNIGILFQDFNFYDHLTAAENIYLGKPKKKKDMEEIIASAKKADAHNFINQYPKKYKTILSEKYKGGIKPSDGQKQKIAIARLFYRNSPLIIFDEPTATIDAMSEYRIFNRIYEFFKNKTVIIISHKFSTVRNADRIIVLDKGKILEDGSHKELMQLEGKYAESFKKQAEGYN